MPSAADTAARLVAEGQYAAALAGLSQPDWPANHAPADPYGRTLQLTDGDTTLERDLVRLCVVKALAQEQRIRQIQAVAFVDEPAYLTIYPEITPDQQTALAAQQKATRKWSLGVLLDTRLGDAVVAGIQGVGP